MKRPLVVALMASSSLVACKPADVPSHKAEAARASTPAGPTGPATRQAWFGDLHLHTAMSFDAYALGTTGMPEDAYRFARGEQIDYLGTPIRRRAPLDFLAVTDHSEYLGVVRQADDPNGPFGQLGVHEILADPNVKGFDRLVKVGQKIGLISSNEPHPELLGDDTVRGNWQIEIDAAEKYYVPGKLTTFVAYEWTSMPNQANLHRNVIFRGPKYPERPYSSLDSKNPEDLWAFLDQQRAQGIDGLDIPHNSNVSDGKMFALVDSAGGSISRAYAEARMRNEPIVELTQNKGTSETHPALSPNDEFAGYELYEYLLGEPTRKGEIDGSYVRQALGRGMELEQKIGANPFRYGFVGASDFHSAASATEEYAFPGALGRIEERADEHHATDAPPEIAALPLVGSAAGLTGVWAEQNTRESIFDALRRRETFATSGVRIRLRSFAGWSYPADLLKQSDWVTAAYADGVPQGADLPPAPQGASPTLIVEAVKDPDSGNLDRIQVVKLWLENGVAREKIFDVAWSGERQPDPKTGQLPDVETTVDESKATYSNSIGAAQLSVEWKDPEFDPATPCLYYTRVLEIPTPRWSTYWSVQHGQALPDGVPRTLQERAWSSPIFYRPGAV